MFEETETGTFNISRSDIDKINIDNTLLNITNTILKKYDSIEDFYLDFESKRSEMEKLVSFFKEKNNNE